MTARGPRYEAQQRGELTYWTGKPCQNGHIDFRRTDNGNCCECDRDVQRERSRIRYRQDPARAIAYSTQYRADHLEQVTTRLRSWAKQKWRNDPQFRLRHKIRKGAARAAQLGGNRILIIGCTGSEFRHWLERQFQPGMSWENYGDVWHIDHIKELTSFDLADTQQFLAACHYTNTQPMMASANIKKGPPANLLIDPTTGRFLPMR